MAGSPSVRFGVPENAEQAWNRLAAAGGSPSDVIHVLRALSRLWTFNSADPRAFQNWLFDLGIKKEHATEEVLLRVRKEFDDYQKAKRDQTERLVEGIASGPNARNFFLALQDYSSELKEVAFGTGLKACNENDLVFLLASLARESTSLIQSCLKHASPSAIVNNFIRYLKTRSSEILIAAPPASQAARGSNETVDVAFLFELISLPPLDARDQLARLSAKNITELIASVEHLFPLLSDEGYGQFVRQQMTYFMCQAAPEHLISEGALATLKRSKEPPETGLLAVLSPRLVTALLAALVENDDPSQGAFTAAVLDALRRNYSDALLSLPPHIRTKLQKSRNPLLSLSARAVNLQLGLMDYTDFQQILVRTLKTDKKGVATQWLADNPEFLESMPIGKLPNRVLVDTLETLAKREPARLIRFLRDSLSSGSQTSNPNFLNASVRALHRLDGSSADELFVDLVVKHSGSSAEATQLNLSREPSLSLLARNIWNIAQRIRDERTWNVLFDAISSKVPNGLILGWLKTATTKQDFLKQWMLTSYVPRLFEQGLLTASFVADLEDASSQASLINAMCARVLNHSQSLQTIATEWPRTRDAQKQELADRASVGLRTGIRTAQNNQALQARLGSLLDSVNGWRSSESPTIDPSIASVSEIVGTETRPADAQLLNALFSARSITPHNISFFLGANPWAIKLYLSLPDSSWPKLELVVEQIVKSLTYFANLNERAKNSMQELDQNIKTDFGITLRDGLDEVEEMLAGYFTFRSILRGMGLDQVEPALGEPLNQEDVSSDKHKLFRDPSQPGRLRIFSLGLKVDGRVVGSSKVLRSGDRDDRD